MNTGAVRCGGTVCNQVSKIFTENPLPIGYYNIDIIPAGASNISILELKNSENYLGMNIYKIHFNMMRINFSLTEIESSVFVFEQNKKSHNR